MLLSFPVLSYIILQLDLPWNIIKVFLPSSLVHSRRCIHFHLACSHGRPLGKLPWWPGLLVSVLVATAFGPDHQVLEFSLPYLGDAIPLVWTLIFTNKVRNRNFSKWGKWSLFPSLQILASSPCISGSQGTLCHHSWSNLHECCAAMKGTTALELKYRISASYPGIAFKAFLATTVSCDQLSLAHEGMRVYS